MFVVGVVLGDSVYVSHLSELSEESRNLLFEDRTWQRGHILDVHLVRSDLL